MPTSLIVAAKNTYWKREIAECTGKMIPEGPYGDDSTACLVSFFIPYIHSGNVISVGLIIY